MLFSDRDFQKVEFEIEDAIKYGGGDRADELHRRIPESHIQRNPSVAAANATVPSFLLKRTDRIRKPDENYGNRSVAAATSPFHLVWMVPLCAFAINYIANGDISTFGLLVAPIVPWAVSAIIGCISGDRSLDNFRTAAAVMQLSAAGFVGTVAIRTWTVEFTEMAVLLTAGVVIVGEIPTRFLLWRSRT